METLRLPFKLKWNLKQKSSCDALTYHSTLEERIAFLTEFVRKANQPPTVAHDHPPTLESITDPGEESVIVTSKVTPSDAINPPADPA